ncbi:MAG: peptide ABC transporter substrate-binding protein [Anaerolineae bacterium]|nr:peptide ABC transporter substrate-binding protein [Anaerolineae bacterium]
MTGNRSPLIVLLVIAVACSCIALLLGCAGVGYVAWRGEEVVSGGIQRQATAVITRVPASPTAQGPDGRPLGGELRLPGAMPPTLDPALSQDSTSAQYIVEIFSGLVTAGPDLELVPDIAEDYEISDDGRVYTFHLRRNVRFHNGTPVTADDFKFSLERSCDPATGSPIAATYLGDIVGAREMLAGRARELAGVRVVDDYTLEIEIDAPRPSFLAKLSHPVAFVVDRRSLQSDDIFQRFTGTGPFKLVEVIPGDRIVLEANRDYYRDPRPALDRVVYRLGGGDPVTMYENDELDATLVGTATLPRITDPASGLASELTVSEQLATFYVGLNCETPPFDDLEVRRAFALALDRQKIVDILYEGTVPAAKTVVPPQMPDYDNEGLAAPALDVEEARRALARSSYGSAGALPPITLYVASATPQTDPVAEAIAVILEENLGVTLEVEQSDWSTFLDGLNYSAHPYQMYILGWIADYADPENFLNVLFSSGSHDNHSGYSNPEVDRLLAEAGLEMDQEERHRLYLEAEEVILSEVPVIPLYHDVEYWLTKPYVRQLPHPAMVVPVLQYAYIQP